MKRIARALKPLPADRFEFGIWKTMKVNIDYHVAVLGHFYSVPYGLRGERVDVRVSATTVEIHHRRERIAVHRRCDRPGYHTTNSDHMPKSHRAHSGLDALALDPLGVDGRTKDRRIGEGDP